jgi:hypothetical protein
MDRKMGINLDSKVGGSGCEVPHLRCSLLFEDRLHRFNRKAPILGETMDVSPMLEGGVNTDGRGRWEPFWFRIMGKALRLIGDLSTKGFDIDVLQWSDQSRGHFLNRPGFGVNPSRPLQYERVYAFLKHQRASGLHAGNLFEMNGQQPSVLNTRGFYFIPVVCLISRMKYQKQRWETVCGKQRGCIGFF